MVGSPTRIDRADGYANRHRLASPATALTLASTVLALTVATVPLSIVAHRHSLSAAVLTATSLVFAAVGAVVARHQPRNRLGWLLLGQAGLFVLSTDASLYAVLRYRDGYSGLPLGWLAVLLQSAWLGGVVLLGLGVLVLPDGQLPSPRWRWGWRSLVALGGLCAAGAVAVAAGALVGSGTPVDSGGAPTATDHATGATLGWVFATAAFFVLLAVTLLVWLVAQIASYRRASGERRLQLKWLLSGGAIFVTSAIVSQLLGESRSGIWQTSSTIATAAEVALPLCMGVAILKFHLYEIDRLISRTVSYAIITGLLVGVFLAVVTLSTDVLPFSSPVGVAVSTLAVAALFNPLRGRVQHAIDRRFNRARYDAEATVASFAVQIQQAVDLDTVRNELLHAVDRSLQPTHATLWTVPPVGQWAPGIVSARPPSAPGADRTQASRKNSIP